MNYRIEERAGFPTIIGPSTLRQATEAEIALMAERYTLAQRCRELEDYIDNHSAITGDYIARLQHTLDERDTLRAEVERLREIRNIAARCAHNGGYLSSAHLIELRALLGGAA